MSDDTSFDKKESKQSGKPNRLISEKSPYLLQHACNPVDWYPWSDDAFAHAKQEDKPIFLSIGYSTCHWCHVMARESFEDPEVAAAMNDAFICIKVDREERPDIDQVYMAVSLMMTGRGGWPLTIIMTPDKRPFFAATYIPKSGRFGQMGMKELIPTVKNLWKNQRGELLNSADRIIAGLKSAQAGEDRRKGQADVLNKSTLTAAYRGLSLIFDSQNGGFGTAPKFPTPHNLLFLLRYWLRSHDAIAIQMVETTLEAMRMGGIFDHVGFGFHRYSTDPGWFVPHFEKMLYDQALMIMAYAEAYQATKKEDYARTAGEIIEYVQRAMTSPEGGFYSAEDADSEGVEGKFYLWTADELKRLMDREEYSIFAKEFDIRDEGNFEKGGNILRMRASMEDTASVIGMPGEELKSRLEVIRKKLFLAREKRIHPAKDDKILTDWNGLMIAALAKAAQILDEPRYTEAAKKAADFVLLRMREADGRLLHRYKGEAGIAGNLDDYAFLIWGLIELYEAAFDVKYLKVALELNRDMVEHFWDGAAGGLFFSPDDGEPLPVRQKEIYDSAVPSGNSTAMLNLLRLSHLTGDPALEERANAIGSAFAAAINRQPLGLSMLMCALDYALGPSYEIAIVDGRDGEGLNKMLNILRSKFMPNKVIIVISGDEIHDIAEFTRSLVQLNGKVTAYVCIGHKCELPTNDPEMMIKLIEPSDTSEG
ncbi:MAG: thioredoxin domain-containing protein [Methanotrichaceae archaeon]